METIKNFLIGVVIIFMSFVILGFVTIAWPVLLGIGSIILSITAVILFVILIFYIVVLIGHITRQLLKK